MTEKTRTKISTEKRLILSGKELKRILLDIFCKEYPEVPDTAHIYCTNSADGLPYISLSWKV